MRLVLASASPRRADLLRTAGVPFDIAVADVDERVHDHETPETYVVRVARAKAVAGQRDHADAIVLGADTAVVVDGEIFGKPADAADAARMLRRLSGRDHEVLTGVALVYGTRLQTFVDRTQVWFRELTEADIAWYVASGEPMGKAGAYALQGLASRFVPRIEGSHATVIGLPVSRVCDQLRELGTGI